MIYCQNKKWKQILSFYKKFKINHNIEISITSCYMYQHTYRIARSVYRPTPSLSYHYWYLLYRTRYVWIDHEYCHTKLISVIWGMICLYWTFYHVITDICYRWHDMSVLNSSIDIQYRYLLFETCSRWYVCTELFFMS